MEKKRYVLYGLAGYVANKHLQAIKDTGGNLIAATDPHDSVGLIDSYFPDCEFFTNESDFRLFCKHNKSDYAVICSPNYLHVSQAQYAMNCGCDVVCEKPVALYPSDLDRLVSTEISTGKRVFTILQLRLNPVLQGLKCELESYGGYYEVDMQYHTPRGKWYHSSWKGNENLSGGLATNIGVHLFDLCQWIWGPVQDIQLKTKTNTEVSGDLFLKQAHITFNLSINKLKVTRSIKIGNREIEFSKGFGNLHSLSYEQILKGNGFGLVDSLPSIVLCDKIRKLGTS